MNFLRFFFQKYFLNISTNITLEIFQEFFFTDLCRCFLLTYEFLQLLKIFFRNSSKDFSINIFRKSSKNFTRRLLQESFYKFLNIVDFVNFTKDLPKSFSRMFLRNPFWDFFKSYPGISSDIPTEIHSKVTSKISLTKILALASTSCGVSLKCTNVRSWNER